MTRFLERFCRIVEILAGLLLGFVTLLVVVSTAGRYLFTSPVPDAFDLSRLMIGACVMWGFASVGYRGGHIKVDLFAEMMPASWRRFVDTFAWLVLLFFVLLLTWKMFERVDSAQRSNELTFDLHIPVWPFMSLIWIGTAASVITILVRLFLVATGQGTLEHSETDEMGDD